MRYRNQITRRTILTATAALAASPALAIECPLGPPPHHKGPPVFMEYDQVELDASYDQLSYEPLLGQVSQRLASNSEATRARIGDPRRAAYGSTKIEELDIYRTSRVNAPVFVFIHGGTWQWGAARNFGFAARRCSSMPAHITSSSISFR